MRKGHVDEDLREQMQRYGFSTHDIDSAYQFLYQLYYFATCDYVHFQTDVVYCKYSDRIGVCCRNNSEDARMAKAVVLINIKTLDIETFPFSGYRCIQLFHVEEKSFCG